MNKKTLQAAAMSIAAFTSISAASAAEILQTNNITADVTWTADNTYVLDGANIFVTSGATLTIEPGTRVFGRDGGSLIITKDGTINADGTKESPIIFTTYQEFEAENGLNGASEPIVDVDNGSWGGLIILGEAPINFFVDPTPGDSGNGDDLNQAVNQIEGISAAGSFEDPNDADNIPENLEYGGSNAEDNSGTLRFVSIRFGGQILAANDEINGLTLGGVGSGTTIEYVEIINNTDDGIEFFGGTVNTRYIVSAFNNDELFDIDEGHQGCHQFWFGLRSGTPDSSGAFQNGLELDGGNGSIKSGPPVTNTKIYNMTLIGDGIDAVGGSADAFAMRDEFQGQFINSVVTDFAGDAIDIEVGPGSGDTESLVGAPLNILFTTWGDIDGATQDNTFAERALFAGGGTNSALGVDVQLGGISRFPDGNLDPVPQATSPLLSSVTADESVISSQKEQEAIELVSYRGAFGDCDNWLRGWTYLDEAGYLPATSGYPTDAGSVSQMVADGDAIEVTSNITADTTWTQNRAYILDGSNIFVTNDAVLTIEPGTKIFGRNGGSLIITKGANIIADGTCDAPIVFTTIGELEHELDPDVFPAPVIDIDNGTWGGLIMLGEAPINFFVDPTPGNPGNGDDFNQAVNQIEGISAAGSFEDPGDADNIPENLEYGGSDATDSSGILRYVSIRFGGQILAANDEINGLTLGGVGSGTVIEFVEIINNTDDGIEFFGGTVNTRYLISAFNNDELFDIDEGHQGCHQFWYGIRSGTPDSSGAFQNGLELDGGNGSIKSGAPFTNTKVYNMTLIGDGIDAIGGSADAFAMRDEFQGQFINSVVTDFAGDALDIEVGPGSGDTEALAGNPLNILHTTWGFIGNDTQDGTSAENTLFAGAGTNSAIDTDPGFRGAITRDTSASFDPRPLASSPLLSSSTATVGGSDRSKGIVQVDFRGAFGEDNWAAGWSYLSQQGFIGSQSQGTIPSTGGGVPPFADSDNDGISDTLEQSQELISLGFVVGNDDSGLFASSLFSQDTIADLVAPDQVIIELDDQAGNVTLSLPVFNSSDLNFTTPLGNMTLTTPQQGDRQFYRLQIPSAQGN